VTSLCFPLFSVDAKLFLAPNANIQIRDRIMVSNPEQLSNVKVCDRVVVTRRQASALLVESEG
jgi:hypothetical protein